MPLVAHATLQKRLRWGDPSYLARMVFSQLIKNDVEGELGYGISASITDNEYPITVIECHKEQVSFVDIGFGSTMDQLSSPYFSATFNEFIRLSEEDVRKAFNNVGR